MIKRTLVFVLIIILISTGFYVWFSAMTSPVSNTSTEPVVFVVGQKEGIRSIANNLKSKGFIRDSLAFFILVKLQSVERKIQAGEHRIASSMSTNEVIDELQHGSKDVWVTIPEGWRIEEIAEKLNKDLGINQTDFISNAKEGFMFPDTYLLPKTASGSAVAALMRKTFDSKITDALATDISQSGKTLEEIVTLASLVEREARIDKDRPLVASVLLNRLDLGMKLDIDATVQYILGFQNQEGDWWKKSLTKNDLATQSPYNTYLNAGLPPAPIANPGFASINAVLHPASSDYLYYLTGRDGITRFATTYQEHLQNIQKYLR